MTLPHEQFSHLETQQRILLLALAQATSPSTIVPALTPTVPSPLAALIGECSGTTVAGPSTVISTATSLASLPYNNLRLFLESEYCRERNQTSVTVS